MIGLATVTEALNPYLLYIKLAAVGLVMGAIVGTGLYVRHVFTDRGRLQAENGSLTERLAVQKAATEVIAAQFNQYIQLNRDIAEAIRKVKVTSATYIESVEAAPAPVVPDGDRLVLIPGGLPKADSLSGLSGFPNRSAARTAAPAPPG